MPYIIVDPLYQFYYTSIDPEQAAQARSLWQLFGRNTKSCANVRLWASLIFCPIHLERILYYVQLTIWTFEEIYDRSSTA